MIYIYSSCTGTNVNELKSTFIGIKLLGISFSVFFARSYYLTKVNIALILCDANRDSVQEMHTIIFFYF